MRTTNPRIKAEVATRDSEKEHLLSFSVYTSLIEILLGLESHSSEHVNVPTDTTMQLVSYHLQHTTKVRKARLRLHDGEPIDVIM